MTPTLLKPTSVCSTTMQMEEMLRNLAIWSPQAPTAAQFSFLLLPHREAFYGGAAGGGKLLQLDTPIPTPHGFVPLANIHPGDPVFGRDGKVHIVLAESELVTAPAWRLTFDDGSQVVAHDDHLWLTYDASELASLTRRDPTWREKRRLNRLSNASGRKSEAFTQALRARNAARPTPCKPASTGTVRKTADMVSTLRTARGRANHAIPVAAPLDLPPRNLLLDPYLLGCWLGDGTTTAPSITSMDEEIIGAFRQEGFFASSVQHKPDNQAATYYFPGLRPLLKELGVLGNKHIPQDYLWGSEEQRRALLAGLLDTDGNVNGASVEFVNTNRLLTEGVAHLARSLGHKVTVREGRARCNGEDHGPVWGVKFAANSILFRLSRKAGQQSVASRRTTQFRYLVDAERTEAVTMKCLRVSADDHLFLVGESLIPTHNSSALLMAALSYVHIPGYNALIVRKNFRDLSQPNSIMDRAASWLRGTKARWNGNKSRWTFPSGATLTFGYLEHDADKFQYQGAEFQMVGYDELTQFEESSYTYLLSRLRRVMGAQVPLRMRGAGNPGGIGHEWVYDRFIRDGGNPERPFIPAKLADNPHVDQVEYMKSLEGMDPVTRAQLADGNWEVFETGGLFFREWFHPVHPGITSPIIARVRYWDLAASVDSKADWTVGVRMARTLDNRFIIEDVTRFRETPGSRDDRIVDVAKLDGSDVPIYIEEEGGSSGKTQSSVLIGKLAGFVASAKRPTGPKDVRARPFSAQMQAGNVFYQPAVWSSTWMQELIAFPQPGFHDDQVDATSGCFNELALMTPTQTAIGQERAPGAGYRPLG